MSKKKGQIGIGEIVMLAVAIIIGVALLSSTFEPVGIITSKVNVVNQTVTAPAVGSSVIGLLRGQAVSNVIVINASTGTVIPASNYTITNYYNDNGELKVKFTSNAGNLGFQGRQINVSYTYEPFGYDTNSGNRAIVNLIVIIGVIAIITVVFAYIKLKY